MRLLLRGLAMLLAATVLSSACEGEDDGDVRELVDVSADVHEDCGCPEGW